MAIANTGKYITNRNADKKLIKLKCGCIIEYKKDRWKVRLFRFVCFKHNKR